MKKIITISISILILIGIILIINPSITGQTIEKNLHSYTYAICNKTNYCEDYVIECENKNPTKITPTGLSIQHPKDWQDPRKQHDFCE